jgi:UDP-N-acetylmuramyl pentapeptide phosphotransferase/UDP-N-acetylglucosamine-1-phosphate transferase
MPFADLLTGLLAALAAAAISAALIVAIMPWLARYALARPNARSSHSVPTPQGAGIAVIAGTTVAVFAAIAAGAFPANAQIAQVFAATLAIAVVGAIDDLRPIPVLPRLALQTLTVGLALYATPAELRIAPDYPLWLERGALALAGVYFVNLVNFMDGLDWIAAAEVIPICAALALLATFEFVSWDVGLTAFALGGAMLGFAPFNRPVAKVFLGDVGSLPIGLLVGWCLLQLAAQASIAAALLLPLYFLADASLTLARRILRGERFWVAHRSHFYQRATVNGHSVMSIVATVFALNVVLAVLAVASAVDPSAGIAVATLTCGVLSVALVLWRFSRAV